jgi:hypothetical protein
LLVTSILVAVVAFIFTVLVCVASSVSFASDVCILSTGQTKINTFTQKDVEVSQNSRFANENTGKKDCGFFGYALGSPETPKSSRNYSGSFVTVRYAKSLQKHWGFAEWSRNRAEIVTELRRGFVTVSAVARIAYIRAEKAP